MGNRKEAETWLLDFYNKLAPGNQNVERMRAFMAGLDDKQFEEWVQALEDGRDQLSYIAPNNVKPALNVARNIKLARDLFGHSFFERIWIHNDETNQEYLTTHPYMVLKLPFRRQAQLLNKKIKIPKNNRTVDNFTGQPTGESKGAALTFPETQVLAALDLTASITELMKLRGGDQKGFRAMNDTISKTGGVSQEAIASRTGVVTSTQTLSSIYTAMHLKNNLVMQND